MPLPDTSLSPGDDRQVINCIHCGAPQPVSRRAISINCRVCSRQLKVESVVIESYQSRRIIETCSSVTVERKGNVFSERIVCGSLVLHGRARANVVSRGPVEVGPHAELRGSIVAPTIAVGEGAVLEGDYRIGVAE
jgi:cytoskeletal protein CcmA (bactofilin family)